MDRPIGVSDMPNPEKPSWKLRRAAVFSLLLLSFTCIVYLMLWGEDTALHRQISLSAWAVAFLTVLAYSGLAVLEDIKLASILGVGK